MKLRFLLLLLFLPCICLAQQVFLGLGYERHSYSNNNSVPKICLTAGYGLTRWCVMGAYTEYSNHYALVAYGNNPFYGYHEHFILYGVYNECHPVTLAFPKFYLLDIYTILRAGLHHRMYRFDEDNLPAEFSIFYPNSCKPYLTGGWGAAINPSKNVGFFYEKTYSTLSTYRPANSNETHKPLRRFGIIIHFRP